MTASDDVTDVEKVLAGETEAFEMIVRRWQKPLINLAFRFCQDRARAEEMAQEAFLRAYRALGAWRKESAFSTWLFALATNLYRSEIRRIPVRTLALDEIAEPADPGAASGEFEEQDRDRAVRRAVLALPSKYRESLILYYFHEMNVADAALSLALPEGTVKARLARGRQILRNKLARHADAPRLREV